LISIEQNTSIADEGLSEIERQDVFIVIPAYNEAITVRKVIRELIEFFPHVVVVDDGSSDETSLETLSSGADLLRHVINLGQGAALQTGIEYSLRAGARVIVTFDADGQHCSDDISKLVRPIFRGQADIVLGSRFLGEAENIPPSRWFLLKGAILFTRLVSRVSLTDVHNGLRAFSRKAAKNLDIKINRMAHASELIDQIKRSNLCYVEVPVQLRYTEYTRKKGQKTLGAFRIITDYILGRIFR
jgi:glycosyltransferase involved in cell wall biosynthesis